MSRAYKLAIIYVVGMIVTAALISLVSSFQHTSSKELNSAAKAGLAMRYPSVVSVRLETHDNGFPGMAKIYGSGTFNYAGASCQLPFSKIGGAYRIQNTGAKGACARIPRAINNQNPFGD